MEMQLLCSGQMAFEAHQLPSLWAIAQQCRNICKKMNQFSKVCLSTKDGRETVHFAVEAKVDDYDSEESIRKIEEISAIEWPALSK